jgi:hypothetical protein
MTQQFHEGQEVEVLERVRQYASTGYNQWRKAKILKRDHMTEADRANETLFPVRFRDGTRGVFDVGDIRLPVNQL